MKQNSNKCVYLFFFDGYVSVAPTIISLAEVLSEKHDKVYIFAKDTGYGRYVFENKKISLIYCDDYNKAKKNLNKVKNYFRSVFEIFKDIGFPKKGDLVINVDDISFLGVSLFSILFRLKLVYLSLEIPVKSVSFLKKIFFLFVISILIQDKTRLDALLDVYTTKFLFDKFKAKTFFIPNSSIVSPCLTSSKPNLIEQFGINKSDKIICAQIGMIHDYVYSYELANVFNNLNDAILIYHDRHIIDKNEPYIKKLLEANSKNLYLSTLTYDFNELHLAYEPIDIGIALYRFVDNNFGLIGRASGKLSFYLKYHKPVIVNKLDGYSDLIEEYNCGVVINDIENSSEWNAALEKIKNNYKVYSDNAYNCYLNEFDFRTKSKNFIEYISK